MGRYFLLCASPAEGTRHTLFSWAAAATSYAATSLKIARYHINSFICFVSPVCNLRNWFFEQMKISCSRPLINHITRIKLKSAPDTSALVALYVVFQLALLGFLLRTHAHSHPHGPNSCGHGISWLPPHVYLSALACISTVAALSFAFITETHLDFIKLRLLLLQNGSGNLISSGDEDIEGGGVPCSCSCSVSYKDYFSAYRLALCVHVLLFPILVFNTSSRLLC